MIRIQLLSMSAIGSYYNESYAPIHDDYMAELAQVNLRNGKVAQPTTENIEMEQTTTREKRRTRYDENNYVLPDEDDEYSPSPFSVNISPDVLIPTQKNVFGKNTFFNWRYGTIVCCTFVLVLVAGVLAYIFTKSTGKIRYFNI